MLPPSGTRDFNPIEYKMRKDVFNKLSVIAYKHAFYPIETPAFERIETLEGKYGEESDKLIFKILKRGNKLKDSECDLALRYDLTIPAIRYYIKNRNNLPKIFKRYQLGPVWRADRPGNGRYREFYQFDFDIYGSSSIISDIECLNMLTDSLGELGIEKYKIKINSRPILHSLMNIFNVPDTLHKTILSKIDKMDRVGIEGLIKSLIPYETIGEISKLKNIFSSNDYNKELLSILDIKKENRKHLKEIECIINNVSNFNWRPNIEIDLTLVRGIDYYTGPIYEIIVPGIKGSIASGGRYDGLSSFFSKETIPACGSSLGIERIIPIINKNIFDSNYKIDVYLAGYSMESTIEQIYYLSVQLRNLGFCVEVQNGGNGKLTQELSYANKIGARFFVYQGEDEKSNNNFFLKEMNNPYSTTNNVLSINEVILFFKEK